MHNLEILQQIKGYKGGFMKTQEGRIGRVFLVKFEHGEDLIKELLDLAERKGVDTAFVMLLGALRKADIVTGPEKCEIPPEPIWHSFDDGREVVAMGTLICDQDGKPNLHLHGALGHDKESLIGCLRENSEVYLVVEGVILEMEGIKARRIYDPLLKLRALSL